MVDQEAFLALFERLKAILQEYETGMRVEVDNSEKYSLIGPYLPAYKKEVWFGKVEIGKRYVSFHLMTVYMFPDLLDSLSDELRKRMQGKSCFNFSSFNEPLFEELAGLTRRSVDRMHSSGILG
jgi:hypothetical protein